MSRFNYIRYDEKSTELQQDAKRMVQDLESFICGPNGTPRTRAESLAITALEECYMWIGKAIRDDQIKRNGGAELQEERGNE